jgi:GDP-4-dehydro-6-deoxy-D-mannose reductase
VPAEVKQDPRFLRPADVPLLLGDNTKVVKATGWTPNIDMSQTVQDMLDYWRKDIQERETALSAK